MIQAIPNKNFYIITIYSDDNKLVYLNESANLFNLQINYVYVDQKEWQAKGFYNKISKILKWKVNIIM